MSRTHWTVVAGTKSCVRGEKEKKMSEKKFDVTNLATNFEKKMMMSRKPFLALILLFLAGASFCGVFWTIQAESRWGFVLFVVFVVSIVFGANLQAKIIDLLFFLEEEHYTNELTIRSESVGFKEARALLVGLAQAMQEADERQVENRRLIKTTTCANTRTVYQQSDQRFSDEFKALQERFYTLLRALVAEGYPFDPNAKFTDFLFVEGEKASSKRETQPPASTPTKGSWERTVGEFPGDH